MNTTLCCIGKNNLKKRGAYEPAIGSLYFSRWWATYNSDKKSLDLRQRGKGLIDYFNKNNLKKSIRQIQFDGLKNEINVGKKINSLLKSYKKIRGIAVPFIRVSNIIELIHPDI